MISNIHVVNFNDRPIDVFSDNAQEEIILMGYNDSEKGPSRTSVLVIILFHTKEILEIIFPSFSYLPKTELDSITQPFKEELYKLYAKENIFPVKNFETRKDYLCQ